MRPVVVPVYDDDTIVNFRGPSVEITGLQALVGVHVFGLKKRRTGTRTTKVQCSGFVLLTTDAKLLYQRTVFVNVVALEVFKQAFALAYHHQEAAAGGVILLEFVKVLGKAFNTESEEGNLAFDRASVVFATAVLLEDFVLLLCCQINCH